MEKIKFIILKLPILSLVLTGAILLRLVGFGVSISHKSYDYKTPVYTSVFDLISEKNTMHGRTGQKSKSSKQKKKIATKEKNKEKSSDQIKFDDGALPKSCARPVVPAVDYGVADIEYMDEKGTTYDYIDDGIFTIKKEMRCFEKVDDDYFKDALFIGDSRSDGLCRYGGTGSVSDFFALESVTIYNIFDVEIPYYSMGQTTDTPISLEELLKDNTYKKIYLAPGMNELGVPDTSSFQQKYIDVIERIKQLQPDAIIYIEGIVHVDKEKSTTDEVYNNEIIVQRNEAISKLSNGYDIFYIDPNEMLCDDSGNLKSEYTNDGVHLAASYYYIWHEYLKKYAIVTE